MGQVDLLSIFWWTDEPSPRNGAGRFAKPFSGGRMSQVHATGQVDLLNIFWWTDELGPRDGVGRFAKHFSGGRMS